MYFTQKLHFGKSNETHYSNRGEGKNLNNISKDNISNIQINNETFNNSNENINNKLIIKYKNLLNQYKINFDNSYNDILIKQKLKFVYIMDALFKND